MARPDITGPPRSQVVNLRKTVTVVPALVACLLGAAGAAQARGPEVQWSVTIGTPVITLPAPVVLPPVAYYPAPAPAPVVVVPAPRPVYWPHGGYRDPRHWDADGDGIPNRHDRVYNPWWDRNGNGVPDRREWRHGPHGDRDRDGIPNRHDRRDDRHDDRRDDRHDDRYDDHRRHDGRHDQPIHWRGPR
jgi:hypothetical protein